jgi:hypothetical protein
MAGLNFMIKLCAADVELGLYNHLGGAQAGVCIPNVRSGLFDDGHEADFVRLTDNYFEEYEIKLSAADIKKDTQKRKGLGHARHRYIARLWFVVPDELADDVNIPKFAGILSFKVVGAVMLFNSVRAPKLNPNRMKADFKVINKFLRLACYRVWSLKLHLQKARGGGLYVPVRRRRKRGRRY